MMSRTRIFGFRAGAGEGIVHFHRVQVQNQYIALNPTIFVVLLSKP